MADVEIDIERLNAVVMPRLETFLRAFVRTATVTAQSIAPVRTGALRAGIREMPIQRTGPWSLESGVESTARYSAPVHEGARPHVIRPRFARALRFEVNGRVVFAQRVNHPGNRAQPFLRNAVHRVASADPRIRLGD